MCSDFEYTRIWREKGPLSCDKCGIYFGGDYYVPVGYFEQPCQQCGGKWGVWPEKDRFQKFIDKDKGEQRPMHIIVFDKDGGTVRKFDTPSGFCLEKYLDAQLGGLVVNVISLEPVLVVHVGNNTIFTFVGFYKSVSPSLAPHNSTAKSTTECAVCK